jgi:hypothetical protein
MWVLHCEQVAFRLHAVLIDESSFRGAELPPDNGLHSSVVHAMSECGIGESHAHIVPTEDVFCMGGSAEDGTPADAVRQEARNQLHALLEVKVALAGANTRHVGLLLCPYQFALTSSCSWIRGRLHHGIG